MKLTPPATSQLSVPATEPCAAEGPAATKENSIAALAAPKTPLTDLMTILSPCGDDALLAAHPAISLTCSTIPVPAYRSSRTRRSVFGGKLGTRPFERKGRTLLAHFAPLPIADVAGEIGTQHRPRLRDESG